MGVKQRLYAYPLLILPNIGQLFNYLHSFGATAKKQKPFYKPVTKK